jgi:hypothetical protein
MKKEKGQIDLNFIWEFVANLLRKGDEQWNDGNRVMGRGQQYVKQGSELIQKGNKIRSQGLKLIKSDYKIDFYSTVKEHLARIEQRTSNAQGRKLQTNTLPNDGQLFVALGKGLMTEGRRMVAEGYLMKTEAERFWMQAIQKVYGNIKVEYCWNDILKVYRCSLETGEVFESASIHINKEKDTAEFKNVKVNRIRIPRLDKK